MRFYVHEGVWTCEMLHHSTMSIPPLESHSRDREGETAAEVSVKAWSHHFLENVKTGLAFSLSLSAFPSFPRTFAEAEHSSTPFSQRKIPVHRLARQVPQSLGRAKPHPRNNVAAAVFLHDSPIRRSHMVTGPPVYRQWPNFLVHWRLHHSLASLSSEGITPLLSQFSVLHWWCHHFLTLLH